MPKRSVSRSETEHDIELRGQHTYFGIFDRHKRHLHCGTRFFILNALDHHVIRVARITLNVALRDE